MEFIEKQFLFGQHRFIAKDHVVHLQRKAYLKNKKNFIYALDSHFFFDRYFIFWLGGFFEKTGSFKIIKRKHFYFTFLLAHYQYKLLKWICYQLNFGTVLFNFKKLKFFLFIYRRTHVKIFGTILVKTLIFKRTLRQFFLWVEYSKFIINLRDFDSVLQVNTPQLLHKGFFWGLLDSCARFKIYTRTSLTARFKLNVRFIFYCDLPIQERWFFKFLFKIFSFPIFTVRSSSVVRVILNTKEDCLILIKLLLRQKLFNRRLRITFLNWVDIFDYLYLRKIKYYRKQNFKKLLQYFYISSYLKTTK